MVSISVYLVGYKNELRQTYDVEDEMFEGLSAKEQRSLARTMFVNYYGESWKGTKKGRRALNAVKVSDVSTTPKGDYIGDKDDFLLFLKLEGFSNQQIADRYNVNYNESKSKYAVRDRILRLTGRK